MRAKRGGPVAMTRGAAWIDDIERNDLAREQQPSAQSGTAGSHWFVSAVSAGGSVRRAIQGEARIRSPESRASRPSRRG